MAMRKVSVPKKKGAAKKTAVVAKRKSVGVRASPRDTRKKGTGGRNEKRRGAMSQAEEKGKESYPMKTDALKAKKGPGSAPMVRVVEEGEGSMEKIRDILFGSQLRSLEKRMTRTEERLIKEVSDLRGEAWKRLDSLEGFIKKEVASLIERLKAEKENRSQSLNELTKELKETAKNLEKRLTQTDEQISKTSRELRQQILDQSKSLSEEARQKNQEVLAALEVVAQELRADKIDRSALSGLFKEMALRINDEGSVSLNRIAKESK